MEWVQNPEVTARLEEEVDAVLGDRLPAIEDMKLLKLTARVINEVGGQHGGEDAF